MVFIMILLEKNLLQSEDLNKIEKRMKEIVERDEKQKEKFGKEKKQLIILKRLVSFIKLK